MKTKTRSTRSTSRLSPDERHARITALADQLAAFAESLDPDEQAAYETRFDMYSPRNSLLIVMQRPDATIVHGFHDWKHLGRRVAKGEHGIQIFAPAGAFTVEDRNAPAGPDGKPGERTIQRFRVTHVWDFAQTVPLEDAADSGTEPV
jgi:hypothetical protein